jgi:LysR family glycine cleavage system transcriptional activator
MLRKIPNPIRRNKMPRTKLNKLKRFFIEFPKVQAVTGRDDNSIVATQQTINSHPTQKKISSMSYRLPPLNALRAFEAAARHLSFKKAAAELSVTPTAVSHQIKLLEEFLGLPLFRRLVRALELTAQGQAMLPKVREGLECFAVAVENARDRVDGGRLLVLSPPSFATRWLVPRLRRFTLTQPSLRLHIIRSRNAIDSETSVATAGFETVDLREEDSQVVVRFGLGNYPGFRVDRMFGSDYVAVCSPKLMRSAKPLRQPADVRFQVLLHDDSIANERVRPSWEEWLRLADVSGVDSSAGPHFSDSGLAFVAAVDGLGIALASRPLVAVAIAEGRLIAPFDITVAQQYAYYVVTPEAISDRPAVKAFRRWLLEEAKLEEISRTAA